ncbi:MAG: hypothetical protein BIFFINMI_01971 [Phycisphaerae bacterium]|nr:hypothetical protein [Phycisphaerae bacterium]
MTRAERLEGCDVLPPLLPPDCQDERKPPEAGHGGRAGQRFAAFNAFVDCTLAKLPRTDALVWFVLFRDARPDTARSAQSFIAKRAGLGKRTVGMAIKRLERAGLLDVLHRGGLNRGFSIYRIRPLAQDGDRRKVLAP